MKKTIQEIRQELKKIYDNVPKGSNECLNACKSGKCNFECCTSVACLKAEKLSINAYIKENKLNFPLITDDLDLDDKTGLFSALPNSMGDKMEYYLKPHSVGEEHPVCSYLTKDGCGIYEVRPHLCRIHGTGGNVFLRCPEISDRFNLNLFDDSNKLAKISREI